MNNIIEILKLCNIPLVYNNQINKYLDFLIKKNNELNLISRKQKYQDIVDNHIFDCLVAIDFFYDYNSITDLGSGSGLPGILLSIIFPEKNITLIEKSPKKIIFLKQCKDLLNLKNLNIIEGLVENTFISTEVITCRAFKRIDEILFLTKNNFKNIKKYILYKGTKEKIDEEIIEAKKKYIFNYKIEKITKIKDKERNIVIIEDINIK